MAALKPMDETLVGYLADESRTHGTAQAIAFPVSEAEVVEVVCQVRREASGPITVQGARTGLAAGAVPYSGTVLNTSRMNRVTGLMSHGDGSFSVQVQPGVVLQDLRRDLERKSFDTTGWSQDSLDALEAFKAAPAQFFPTDPTETSACLGGMAACNASGARSFRYGPVRPHISGLRLVTATGDVIDLVRGQVQAQDGILALPTQSGATLEIPVPTYEMPQAKCASGYFASPAMDAVDLIIGSDGTLGVITQLTCDLLPVPALIWGVNCFFSAEDTALSFVELLQEAAAAPAYVPAAEKPVALEAGPSVLKDAIVALEYFDGDALDILRAQRAQDPAFSSLPELLCQERVCVYCELAASDHDQMVEAVAKISEAMESVGAQPDLSWVGTMAADRERQRFFRHAVPESVNMLIDSYRAKDPAVTKVGSDMSVPRGKLRQVMELYRSTIQASGLQSAAWGHIGDNHLHVNLLPHNEAQWHQAKDLLALWAKEVSAMGGAVSAEHGVGKIKRDFLMPMYGLEGVRAMARTKLALDPEGLFGQGTLFSLELLQEEAALQGAPPKGC